MDHLRGSTAIVDAFSDRIYPELIPQHVRDWQEAMVVNEISTVPEMYLGGEVGRHTSIIQVDVWTDGQGGRKRANDLGELVRNRLSGYRGQFGTGCFGVAEMIRSDTLASDPLPGSDIHRRRVSMDFRVGHTADVPTLT